MKGLRWSCVFAACLLAGCTTTGSGGGDAPAKSARVARAVRVEPASKPAPPAPVPQPPPAPPATNFDAILREAHAAFDRGDHAKAMASYEQVLNHADDPRDQVRALICLATVRLMPSSPVRDTEAAGIVVAELERRIAANRLQYEFFGQVELLRLIQGREQELRNAHANEKKLRQEIAKREALIRQLRALTVDGS